MGAGLTRAPGDLHTGLATQRSATLGWLLKFLGYTLRCRKTTVRIISSRINVAMVLVREEGSYTSNLLGPCRDASPENDQGDTAH